MGKNFTRLATFHALLGLVLSCSCFPQTFEKRYCDAKLSLRGTVLAKFDNCPGTCDPIDDQVNGKIFYLVNPTQIFKGYAARQIILETAVNGALCGVNLQIGGDYFFNLGTRRYSPIFRHLYSIGLCSFPNLWNNLTPAQKQFAITNANGGEGCPSLSS